LYHNLPGAQQPQPSILSVRGVRDPGTGASRGLAPRRADVRPCQTHGVIEAAS